MPEVRFHPMDEGLDFRPGFAVIAARYRGQWLFCRHKNRNTWEIPGGHREPEEDILETARRELYEETGATEFSLAPVSLYSVTDGHTQTFGMLYLAEVRALGPLPETEIAEITRRDALPENLTYPLIQTKLQEKAQAALYQLASDSAG